MSEHQLTPISPIFDLFNNRDKCQPRIFRLRDESLEESDNLQVSGSMFNVQSSMLRGEEIVEDLEAALEQFREIAADLGADVPTKKD